MINWQKLLKSAIKNHKSLLFHDHDPFIIIIADYFCFAESGWYLLSKRFELFFVEEFGY